MNVRVDGVPEQTGLVALTLAVSVEVTVITLLSGVTHPLKAIWVNVIVVPAGHVEPRLN